MSREALYRAVRRMWRGVKSATLEAGSYLAYTTPMLPVLPPELTHPALRPDRDGDGDGDLGSEEDWSLWRESLDDPQSWPTHLDERAP